MFGAALSSAQSIQVKVKVKTRPCSTNRAQVHLPLLGLELVGGKLLMSVTRGQCDARPTIIFPAARDHCPLAGTECLVIEAHVC